MRRRNQPRARTKAILRRIGFALAALFAAYLIGRAVVEVIIVDFRDPKAYEQDWGGPHYLGVMAVHAGPGILALVLIVLWVRRTKNKGRLRRGRE